MPSLSDTQNRCLLKLFAGDDGVQMREPTKLALIRMGYAFRENLPDGITNGWCLRLTNKGTQYCKMVRGR